MQVNGIEFPGMGPSEALAAYQAMMEAPDTVTPVLERVDEIAARLSQSIASIEIPESKETDLSPLIKAVSSLEKAIKSVKFPEIPETKIPDNKEMVAALKLVEIAITKFRTTDVKIPEPVKKKGVKVHRKMAVVDGYEVPVIDWIEDLYG